MELVLAVSPVETKPIVRDVVDAGIRIGADVPTSWAEAELPGMVLVAGGPLEDRDTLPLSLQIRADGEVSSAPVAAHVIPQLEDTVVVFTGERTDEDGTEESVAEVEHRSELSGTFQVSMLRTFYLPERRIAVSAIGSCGSGAGTAARDALRDVLRSITVGPVPAATGE